MLVRFKAPKWLLLEAVICRELAAHVLLLFVYDVFTPTRLLVVVATDRYSVAPRLTQRRSVLRTRLTTTPPGFVPVFAHPPPLIGGRRVWWHAV